MTAGASLAGCVGSVSSGASRGARSSDAPGAEVAPDAATVAAEPRYNIVFVFTDEWRAQALGYAGDVNAHTPSIDRFAAGKAINFTNAVSGCSVCCPYRASLLTGQYPLTNGIFINDVELDPNCHSIARAFAGHGYLTGYIGKWHVYGSPEGKFERRGLYVPRDYQMGFDYWKGFECTHRYNQSRYFFNDDPTVRHWDGYDAFAESHDAAAFIRDHANDQQPFLLMVSLGPPHFPLDSAPEQYRKMYENREVLLRPNVPAELREKAQEELRGYYAHIAALDDAFPIITDAIEQASIADRTIFIYTSDHGDMRQSQALRTKLFPWDESVCVPFLLHHPDLPATWGTTNAAPIDAPDIMPTLMGLCGLPIPGSVQGRNWAPIIQGREALTGDEVALLNMPAVFSEIKENGMKEYRGIRTRRHTYVRNIDGPWLMYDNEADPYQMRNLVNRPEHAALQAQLEHRLQQKLRECNDEFLPSRVYLERAGLTHYHEVNMPCLNVWRDPFAGSTETPGAATAS